MTPDKIEVDVVAQGEVYEWRVWLTMHNGWGDVWSRSVWHRGICRTESLAWAEGEAMAQQMRDRRAAFR